MSNATSQQLQRTLDQLKQAEEAMRQSQQSSAQGQQGDAAAQAQARRAAQAIGDASEMLRGLQQQDAAGRVGELADRANQLDQEQHGMEDRVKQQFGDLQSKDRALQQRGSEAMNNMLRDPKARQAAEQTAKDEEALSTKIGKLEDDIRKAERDLRTSQPNAAARLRDGAAETQEIEAQRRVQQMADNIRSGYGPMIGSNEAGVSQAMDNLRDEVQRAQQAVQSGQQKGSGKDQQERALAEAEHARQMLENLQQQGLQRGGQQRRDAATKRRPAEWRQQWRQARRRPAEQRATGGRRPAIRGRAAGRRAIGPKCSRGRRREQRWTVQRRSQRRLLRSERRGVQSLAWNEPELLAGIL